MRMSELLMLIVYLHTLCAVDGCTQLVGGTRLPSKGLR